MGKKAGWVRAVSLVLVVCGSVAGCSSSSGGGGGGGGGGTTPSPSSSPSTAGSGTAAACTLTNITSATTASCYDCMRERCCAEMQACDKDPDCVYCIDNPIDSSERCVDPSTFSVYPNRKNLGTCQTDKCVPPCGAKGGSRCVPGDCVAACANYNSGCR